MFVPYCKNCVNSKCPGSAPRPVTRFVNPASSSLLFGARDVGGALQMKLACWTGNSEGCGRPVRSVITASHLLGVQQLLTTCQTDHIILSHELDNVLQGRWMPSSALGVDVVREIWRHVAVFPDGDKLPDYVKVWSDYTTTQVEECTRKRLETHWLSDVRDLSSLRLALLWRPWTSFDQGRAPCRNLRLLRICASNGNIARDAHGHHQIRSVIGG
jgi:hypothetical protein